MNREIRKMKRKLLILFLICTFIITLNPTRSYAHMSEEIGPYLLNGFVGYQYGIGTNGYILSGFDANLVLMVLNGGYSNKIDFGPNAYIGIGYASLLQIQYGFAYSQKKDLLRLRSDLPMHLLGTKGIWRTLAFGLYWEKRFNDSDYSNNFGVSLTIGISNLIWNPERK